MKSKMNLSVAFSILSVVLAAAGSALGQYATMKQWKDEMNEKVEDEAKQLPESNN